MRFKKFLNNYLDEAKRNTPEWLLNKKFTCIECEYQPIYLKEKTCPCCYQDHKETQNDVSLNVGISILGWLEKNYNGKDYNPSDKELKSNLINAIISALPIIDESKAPINLPRMYVSKSGVLYIDESVCDKLIKHYCNEFNKNKFRPQHISKISVRKLFGYHSYDLNFDGDLSIIYGSNGLGKTTIFKLLECILIRPTCDELTDVFRNANIMKYKINKKINYMLNIPFKSIRVEFRSGDWVCVSKTKDDNNEDELSFDYIPYGFDSNMPIYGINKNQITKDGKSRYYKMKRHYDNIDKLFPNINNYNKFLFVKVNRFLDINDLKRGIKNYISHSNKSLINSLDKMQKPAFYTDFMNSFSSIICNLNKSINKDFPIDKVVGCRKKIFDFSGTELLSYLESNKDASFVSALENEDDLLEKISRKDNCFDITLKYVRKIEKDIKNDEMMNLVDIYKKMQEDIFNNQKYRFDMLDFIFKSKSVAKKFSNSKSTLLAIRQILKFYRNFLLLKELFESLYYEYDPARKKLIYSNDLLLKTNTSLDGDFGQILTMDSLSSGELNLITILYNLIFKATSESIALIDEPEISLHMAWQQQFADLVKTIMEKQPGMQVIIASHSPFLTSGHDEYFVGADLIDEEGE